MSDVRDRSTTYDDRSYDPADDVRAPAWEEAAAAAAVPAPIAAGEPLAPGEVTGNLRRYARWQWKDYWQRRGFWLAGAALFCVWVLVHWLLADRLQFTGPNTPPRLTSLNPDEVIGISHGCFAVGGVLAGLLGVGGLVSRERERGLQRFLFAKPVNALRYYLQGFAINGVGSLLVLVGAILLAALTAGHALAVGSLLAVALGGYLLGAGATFLVSTLWRFDAPLAGAYLLAGFPVVAFAQNGYWWARALQWLFPHGPAFAIIQSVAPTGGVSELPSAFLLVALVAAAWGVAFTAAAATVLRRRAICT